MVVVILVLCLCLVIQKSLESRDETARPNGTVVVNAVEGRVIVQILQEEGLLRLQVLGRQSLRLPPVDR